VITHGLRAVEPRHLACRQWVAEAQHYHDSVQSNHGAKIRKKSKNLSFLGNKTYLCGLNTNYGNDETVLDVVLSLIDNSSSGQRLSRHRLWCTGRRKDINIRYRGGGKQIDTPYREQGTNYPEPRWAGPTPAYGLFARHVDGLMLRNVRFELMRPDERPDIILDDVTNHSIQQ